MAGQNYKKNRKVQILKKTVKETGYFSEEASESDSYMWDVYILYLIYMFMQLRNAFLGHMVYPIFLNQTFKGFFPLFGLTYRCFATRFGNGQQAKPVMRNMVFNICR
jgi:hypothetical protein